MPVSPEILRAFGLSGQVTPLKGGENKSVLVDGMALKPVSDPVFSEWVYGIWSQLNAAEYRISRPVKSLMDTFIVDGWGAATYERGKFKKDYLSEKISISKALHKNLAGLNASKMPWNHDPWATAHRITWQKEELPAEFPQSLFFSELIHQCSIEMPVESQLIHADLSGNILFEEGLPPLIIDFSPTIGPVAYAESILICDSIAWFDNPVTALKLLPETPCYKQMMLKAILFRLLVATIQKKEVGFQSELRNFEPILHAIGKL